MNREELDILANKVIGVAIDIHKSLGPGFTEKIYAKAVVHDLQENGIQCETEKSIQIRYKNLLLGQQRIDLIAEDELIIEFKNVPKIQGVHLKQMLSYLKVANKRLGLILNFNNSQLEIKRVANNF